MEPLVWRGVAWRGLCCWVPSVSLHVCTWPVAAWYAGMLKMFSALPRAKAALRRMGQCGDKRQCTELACPASSMLMRSSQRRARSNHILVCLFLNTAAGQGAGCRQDDGRSGCGCSG